MFNMNMMQLQMSAAPSIPNQYVFIYNKKRKEFHFDQRDVNNLIQQTGEQETK